MSKSPTANPYQTLGRTVALVCFSLVGIILFAGAFFVVAAANVTITELPIRNLTNPQLVGLTSALFLILALVFLLTGRHLWRIWGNEQRHEKAGAKTAVGCLLISSLGCGLWALLSGAVTLLSGVMFMTGLPAGLQDVLVGGSGFVIAIIIMLLIAGYLWRVHVRLQPAEQVRAQQAYFKDLQIQVTQLSVQDFQRYAQAQTRPLLRQLDAIHKRAVIQFLYDLRLIVGHDTTLLAAADLHQVDLHGMELSNINFQGANLQGANLQNTNLRGANFHKANLRKANCRHSNFYRANLWEADLWQADLTSVDFQEANLTGAKVTPTQLNTVRSLAQAIMPDSTRYIAPP